VARTIALDLVGRDLLSKSLIAAGASAEELKRRLNDLGRRINVGVDADTGRARAELDETKRDADKLNGKRASVKVDVDTSGALSGLQLVGLSLASLAAVPAATVVSAGLLSLVPAAAAAGAGVAGLAAVAVPAFSEIKAALQAQTQAQAQSGASAASAASRSLALAGAEAQVAAAVRQAAYAHTQALQAVHSAEETYQQSLRDEITAQKDLVQARKDAAAALQAASDNTADAKLSERQATFDLADAEDAYNKAVSNPAATADQIARAKLTLDQARQNLKERHEATQKAIADERAATKAGVEGSDAVQQARRRLAEADQKATDAERALAQARANVARTDQQSADQVAAARRAVTAASLQGAGASSALNAAMAALSPSARALMGHWIGLTGAFKAWRLEMEPTVLPIFGRAIDILKGQIPGLTPIVRGAAGVFSGFVGDVGRGAKSPFWSQFKAQITGLVPKSLGASKTVVEDLAVGLMHIVSAFVPYAPTFLGYLTKISGAFRGWATNLPSSGGFQALIAYVKANGPQVAQTAQLIAQAIVHIAVAVAPLAGGGGVGAVSTLRLLATVLNTMSPGQIQAIALAIAAVKTAMTINTVATTAAGGLKLVNLALQSGGKEGPLFARGLVLAGKGLAGLGTGGVQALGRVRDGYRSAAAAQSAFSGRAGSLGGLLRKTMDAAGGGWERLAGGARSAGAAVGGLAVKLGAAARAAALAAAEAGKTALQYALMGVKAAWSAVQLVAVKAAQLAVKAATMAWTAIQWALDAAMDANPIGLVVIAIAALAAGVIYAYTHFSWFRNIVNGIFEWLKNAVTTVIGFVRDHWRLILTIMLGPLGLLISLVTKYWGEIKKAFTTAVNTVLDWVKNHWRLILVIVGGPLGLVIALVTKYWSQIKNTTVRLFNDVKDAVGRGLHAVQSAFSTAVSAVGRIWNGLKAVARTPVNFVIGLYNNGVRTLVNGIAGLVGLGHPLGKIPYFAQGGVAPGYAPGRDKLVAAVSPGEAIMRPEWTRAVGTRFVHTGNRIARTRGVAGVRKWLAEGGAPLGSEGAGFSSGGIAGYAGAFGLGGIVSSFINGAKNFVLGNVTKAARGVLGRVLGGAIPGHGGLHDVVAGLPHWAANSLLGWLSNKAGQGTAGMQRGLSFAKAQAGKPYIWGGVGPAGYDCSGFMSAIWNVIHGRSPYSRMFSTASFGGNSGPGGFVRNQRSGFRVGVTQNAGDGIGHMAGTLLGVNVESSGSIGPHYGPSARGADNPLFSAQYGLKADTGHLALRPGWNPPVYNGTGSLERLSTAHAAGPLEVVLRVEEPRDPLLALIVKNIKVDVRTLAGGSAQTYWSGKA
jgi:hypothetical protein